MSGGGKGGEQTTTQRLDPRLEQGAASAVAGALQSAGLDYSPNRGVAIAGFTPQQKAAFEGADQAASAFGVPTSGGNLGIPETQTEQASGIEGYATGGIYDNMKDASISQEQQVERQGILDYYTAEGQKISTMKGLGSAGGGGK